MFVVLKITKKKMAPWKKIKYLKLAKGKRGKAKNVFSIMVNKVEKSLTHAYKGRKLRRRNLKRVWTSKINAGAREHHIAYNQFIFAKRSSNIHLNRKILAELAENEPYSFKAVVDELKIQGGVLDNLIDTSPDMSLYEAMANQYLVIGDVKEVDKELYKEKFVEIAFDDMEMTEEEREMITYDTVRPDDGTLQNVFRK